MWELEGNKLLSNTYIDILKRQERRTVVVRKDGLFSVEDERSSLIECLCLFWRYVNGCGNALVNNKKKKGSEDDIPWSNTYPHSILTRLP